MKRISIFTGVLIILAAAIVFFGGVFTWQKYGNPKSETASWKTYQNGEYGFSVKYPNALKLYQAPGPGACSADYCVELLHGVNDTFDYRFSIHISKNGYGVPVINSTQKAIIANQSANYEEYQEKTAPLITRWYSFVKDGITYVVSIDSDQSSQNYNQIREAMLSTFEFTK